MPNTKQACLQKTSFSAGWQWYGGCLRWGVFLGDTAGTGVPAEICREPLLHSGQTEATRTCGWAPAVPGAGLPGWQSPGEVTPVCQNLPVLDRELPPPRTGPYPHLCHEQQDGRKENHLLKVEECAAPFLPSLPFPSCMHPAILGMSGMWLVCDFNKTYLIMFILTTEYFQIFLLLISSPWSQFPS